MSPRGDVAPRCELGNLCRGKRVEPPGRIRLGRIALGGSTIPQVFSRSTHGPLFGSKGTVAASWTVKRDGHAPIARQNDAGEQPLDRKRSAQQQIVGELTG